MTEADWPAVRAGFAHAFADARPPAVWDWRFRRHDGAAGWSGWIAPAPDGSVAAFVGASRHRGWLDGAECEIQIGRDHYSHPRWRGATAGRRGVYARTETAFLDSIAGEAALCLGFGQARRVRLGQQLGISTPLAGGQWLACDLSEAPSAGVLTLVRPADFADPAWDAFWRARRARIRAGICRDAAFLAWRFDPRQGIDYRRLGVHALASPEPAGYLVWRPLAAGSAVLVDAALPGDPQGARDAWSQAARDLRRRGVGRVVTFSTPASPEHALWPLLGFRPCPAPLAAQPVYRAFRAALGDGRMERDYAFTLADGDLF